MSGTPITFAQFEKHMADLAVNPPVHVAVAVSGGADSLCLALLMHEWAQHHGGQLTALTVDHGLRAASAHEAAQVKAWLSQRGIAHETLCWEGEKPLRDIQAQARQARYALLVQWCEKHGAPYLAVGHHALDQCETFLMRLTHKSGMQGLCGMQSVRGLPGSSVRLIRPLLSLFPQDLKATLGARGQAYVSDPSNEDVRYERTQWRQRLSSLPAAFPETMLALQGHIKAHWRHFVTETMDQAPLALHCGYATCEAVWFFQQGAAAQELVLSRLLASISGNTYPPSPQSIKTLRELLTQGRKISTLHGCVVCVRQGILWVGPEVRAVSSPCLVAPRTPHVWGLFHVMHEAEASLEIGVLGQEGAAHFRSLNPAMPACIYWGLPALREGLRVIQVADLREDSQVQLVFKPNYGLSS